MNEAIIEFLANINNRSHVLRLFDKVDYLTVKLSYSHQNVVIAFQHSEARILEAKSAEDHSCEISGDVDSLFSLIEGKERLRILVKQGRLVVRGTFRTILLLESAFYLVHSGKRGS